MRPVKPCHLSWWIKGLGSLFDSRLGSNVTRIEGIDQFRDGFDDVDGGGDDVKE